MFEQLLFDVLDVFTQLCLRVLVGLCINNAERNVILTTPHHEFKVNFLQRQSAVDQHEQTNEVLSLFAIVINDRLYLSPFILTYFCKTISREIDKIPLVVDDKMIDELCLSWRGRS